MLVLPFHIDGVINPNDATESDYDLNNLVNFGVFDVEPLNRWTKIFYCIKHTRKVPMQYTEIFKVVKNENFHWKIFAIFLIFAQNIDCGYTLEPPRRGGSN